MQTKAQHYLKPSAREGELAFMEIRHADEHNSFPMTLMAWGIGESLESAPPTEIEEILLWGRSFNREEILLYRDLFENAVLQQLIGAWRVDGMNER